MVKPVIKASSYILAHAPDMLLNDGTTMAEVKDDELRKKVKDNLMSFEQAVSYPAHQCYIGNITPEELKEVAQPWYENGTDHGRFGRFGEIMPQDEFYGLLKISDSFDLVLLEKSFVKGIRPKIEEHPLFSEDHLEALGEGVDSEDIQKQIKENEAAPLHMDGELIGCVRRAHDSDPNLNAHIILENTAAKASGVLALLNLLHKNNLDPKEVSFIIETSEEACGDNNQRGGGNFAKAIGEVAGCVEASGSDIRAFCAAPAHGLVNAASLVSAGIYENVVVLAGGAVAKLGMNARDHVKKEVPVLEDVLGGFAVLVSADDGESPIIRTDSIGLHKIGSGASPQAVTQALVTAPLDKLNLSVGDVDKYSVEMQNPEITKPAGSGDVPQANYKMIAALGVKQGDLERSEIMNFVQEHGMPGWAPTQGHIPSGVPYVGFAREAIMNGDIQRAMIIGKGSLFLARMTNLFDGISFLLEKNEGESEETGIDKEEVRKLLAEALRGLGDSLDREQD